MSFSRYLACFAGSLLLSLSGRTAEATDAGLGVTNVTFRNHVQPVLAKFGCSSGACHGAAAGRTDSNCPCVAMTTRGISSRSPAMPSDAESFLPIQVAAFFFSNRRLPYRTRAANV